MVLSPGTRFGPYDIVSLLGSGGMGAVYRARDAHLGRDIAIKVLSQGLAGDDDAVARFEREARTVSSLNHPHIVHVYDIADADTPSGSMRYIAMELVTGDTLRVCLRRGDRQSDLLRLMVPVVDALAKAHAAGVVHRDLKPENIIVSSDGYAKVVDFGLAKLTAVAAYPADAMTTPPESATATGIIVGTVGYMSPEQAGGHVVDARSDVFSLGCILFEILTGRQAFSAGTALATLHAIIYDDAPRVATVNPAVPDGLARIVERCLAKNPAQRYQRMSDLGQDLRAGIGEAAAIHRDVPPTAPIRRPRRFLGAREIALAAVAVALGAGLMFWRPGPVRPADDTRLVIAVAPFYGPDDESAREGKVMGALVERAIVKRLGEAIVLGVDVTKERVRSHQEARDLGRRLGARMVVWGEAFVVRGETEVQPYFTMLPPAAASARASAPTSQAAMLSNPLGLLEERESGPMVVQAQVANQIELRRTGAAGVGDVVLLLAGAHALYAESNALKALLLFKQVPKSPESLRYQAEAEVLLNRPDDAAASLRQAIALNDSDAQSHASLGDVELAAGRFASAAVEYARAAQIGGAYSTRRGILYQDRIYAKETYIEPIAARRSGWIAGETGYLLAYDMDSGRVVERYRLPGPARTFRVADSTLEIVYGLNVGYGADPPVRQATIRFASGRFDRPVFYGTSLLLRRQGMINAVRLAGNFNANRGFGLRLKPASQATDGDLPRTFIELEAAAAAAFVRDPTQPWYLLVRGDALWATGKRDEAAAIWGQIFSGTFPSIPYYEYAWVAEAFERDGQPEWADRASAEALRRRQRLPQPIVGGILIERLINVLNPERIPGLDLERVYRWYRRSRELSGITEGDDFAAAVWARHFRNHGDPVRAGSEADLFARARSDPMFSFSVYTLIEYAQYAFVTSWLAGWVILVLRVRRPARGAVASLSPGARRMVIAAVLLPLALALPLGWMLGDVVRRQALPVMSDSVGHPEVLQWADGRVAAHDTPGSRFTAAVAHHYAGSSDRARALYRTLPDDPRAVRNLAALDAGSLVPPESLTSADLHRALSPPPRAWPGEWWRGARLSWQPPKTSFAISIRGLCVLNLAIALALVFAFARIPAAAPDDRMKPFPRSRAVALGLSLLPGAHDITLGSLWRGYLTASLFLLPASLAAQQALLKLSGSREPALGLFTADYVSVRTAALPTLSGRMEEGLLAPYHYWTILWAYPYAPLFFAIVGAAAIASLALHGRQVRAMWRHQ